jgi:hypothetical protein
VPMLRRRISVANSDGPQRLRVKLSPGHRQKGLFDRTLTGTRHELCGRRVREDLAPMQHDDAIRLGHFVAQMRRPQHRNRAFGTQLQHERKQIAAACRVKTDRRLVHQQNPRFVQQRARQFNATAIAATQLGGFIVRALGKPEPRQFFGDALLGHSTRNSVQPGMEKEISGHRQFEIESGLLKHDAEFGQGRHRIDKHVMSHDLNTARVRDEQAGKKLEQRGLAGTVWAEQRDKLAGRRRETDAIQRADRAVTFNNVVEDKRGSLFVTCHSSPGSCLPAPLVRT